MRNSRYQIAKDMLSWVTPRRGPNRGGYFLDNQSGGEGTDGDAKELFGRIATALLQVIKIGTGNWKREHRGQLAREGESGKPIPRVLRVA